MPSAFRRRLVSALITCAVLAGALALATSAGGQARATVVIKPGSVGALDIRRGAIQVRHLAASTMRTLVGSGRIANRPRALPGNEGWLYFATDVDGGALFRSSGRDWVQLTRGRTGAIARGSIGAALLDGSAVTAPKLADRAVTARAMSMDAWRAISSSGPLERRPDASTRPAGSFWFAPDVDGGSLYANDGTSWKLAGRATQPAQQLTDQGTLAQRPAAATSNAGHLYLATDQDGGTLYRSTGTTWTQAASGVTNPISGSAGGVLAGSYPAPTFAAGSVDSAAIALDSIGASKLIADSVGASEISTGAVTSDELASASVESAELAGDAVTAPAIATGAVGSDELATGSVGSDELVDGSVDIAEIDPAVWSTVHAVGLLGIRPPAAGNSGHTFFATDESGGTLSISDGTAWTVAGRARSPRIVSFLNGTATNMPAALGELIGTNRNRAPVDLSTATEVRMYTNVTTIGHTTAALCVQYSLDFGVSWFNFDETTGTAACASGVAQVTVATLGLRQSAWQSIPVAARDESALVRVVSVGGNGAVDPVFGVTAAEFR